MMGRINITVSTWQDTFAFAFAFAFACAFVCAFACQVVHSAACEI